MARTFQETKTYAAFRAKELLAIEFNQDVFVQYIDGSVFHIAYALFEDAYDFVIVYCEHFPTLIFEKEMIKVGPEYRPIHPQAEKK